MQMIGFWIVRKGENMGEIPPEVRDAISAHPHNKCLFCGEGRELGAVVAFRGREPKTPIGTARVCTACAQHDDEKLAEMTGRAVVGDGVVQLPPKFSPRQL